MKKNYLFAAVLFCSTASVGVWAQATDTLAKIKSNGKAVMGVRESSSPLSFT